MSPAQRLRALAKRTALDGIAEELVAIAAELDQRPAAQEVDDGDITGQPGPLPETGWDEVPEGAFRKPSPTAGMNLGERIKHVGGRENAAGYIEFGSVMAVRALVRQYLRDLPAPQQATPEPIPMVLHCPKCGMQHIDGDNWEELRIQAAESGRDREGDRDLERWLEDNEWNNPPHRSHLCHGCGTIWRPADVPTTGVKSISTKGKADTWEPVQAATPEPVVYKCRHCGVTTIEDEEGVTMHGLPAPDHPIIFDPSADVPIPGRPEPVGEPVAQVSDLFPSVRNKLHAQGFDSDAPLFTRPAPGAPESPCQLRKRFEQHMRDVFACKDTAFLSIDGGNTYLDGGMDNHWRTWLAAQAKQ